MESDCNPEVLLRDGVPAPSEREGREEFREDFLPLPKASGASMPLLHVDHLPAAQGPPVWRTDAHGPLHGQPECLPEQDHRLPGEWESHRSFLQRGNNFGCLRCVVMKVMSVPVLLVPTPYS